MMYQYGAAALTLIYLLFLSTLVMIWWGYVRNYKIRQELGIKTVPSKRIALTLLLALVYTFLHYVTLTGPSDSRYIDKANKQEDIRQRHLDVIKEMKLKDSQSTSEKEVDYSESMRSMTNEQEQRNKEYVNSIIEPQKEGK